MSALSPQSQHYVDHIRERLDSDHTRHLDTVYLGALLAAVGAYRATLYALVGWLGQEAASSCPAQRQLAESLLADPDDQLSGAPARRVWVSS